LSFERNGAKKVQIWWNEHKVADEKRRKEEEEARRIIELKKSAVSKLTAEERKALGL
jgi:hypothetical protein